MKNNSLRGGRTNMNDTDLRELVEIEWKGKKKAKEDLHKESGWVAGVLGVGRGSLVWHCQEEALHKALAPGSLREATGTVCPWAHAEDWLQPETYSVSKAERPLDAIHLLRVLPELTVTGNSCKVQSTAHSRPASRINTVYQEPRAVCLWNRRKGCLPTVLYTCVWLTYNINLWGEKSDRRNKPLQAEGKVLCL